MLENSLTGANLIGGSESGEGDRTIRAFSTATSENLNPSFCEATLPEIHRACRLADEAAHTFRSLSPTARGEFLERVANEILNLGSTLINRCHSETALPIARLEGERGRTVGQLRMFADVCREGRWHDVRIEHADPSATPVPRPDLRRYRTAIGPVVVFGASNFPLAFSVAGGDSASAWAAGCPVIVKAHPAHPGTSELVGRAIQRAIVTSGLPSGVFSLLHGGAEVGQALITDPRIKAVGFTGSRRGGEALMVAAASRPMPIPVFAEMGSVNPVILLPAAAKANADFAEKYFASLTMGVGQFCTNPGVLILVESPETDLQIKRLTDLVTEAHAQPMLTAAIANAYRSRCQELHVGSPASQPGFAAPGILVISGAKFASDPSFREEVFGPAAIIVRCTSIEEVHDIVALFDGELTATIWSGPGDESYRDRLAETLSSRVGRLITNGFPTGVTVGDAMHHGGPFPASSDCRFTSVGRTAIDRWARPICYQDCPDEMLPPELQEANPLKIPRCVGGIHQ